MLSLFSRSIFLVGPHQIFLGYFLSPFVSLNKDFIQMFAVLSTSPVLPDTFSSQLPQYIRAWKKAVHKANARQMKTLLLKKFISFLFYAGRGFFCWAAELFCQGRGYWTNYCLLKYVVQKQYSLDEGLTYKKFVAFFKFPRVLFYNK